MQPDNTYVCPPAHDHDIDIYFDKMLMPYDRMKCDLVTPSVPNPKSYSHLQLVQKNLAWTGVDVIRAWNVDNGQDAVIYLGRWGVSETEIHNI